MAVDHNNPQSRDEEILIATIDGTEYNKNPQSRMEELLLELKEAIEEGGGGGGTTDYENLSNQPQVNGETLIGDKSGADLGLVDAEEGKGLSTNDYDDTEKAAVADATSAISAMKDGTDIDSFGDVEVALLDKQDELTAGKYIQFTNDEISVKRDIAYEADEVLFAEQTNEGLHVTVTVGSTTLYEETLVTSDSEHTVLDLVQTRFSFRAVRWILTYLKASKTRSAGDEAVVWPSVTDTFVTTVDADKKLIIQSELDDAINSAVSKCYHHAGTKTCAELLPALLIAANEGNVYEITDSGTTTSDFMEGIGHPIKEGDNIGVARVSEGVYKFDLLSGFVDTSNFVQKSSTAGLIMNDGTIDTVAKQPATDNNLTTTDKTTTGAVNELKSGLTTLDDEVNGDATTYPYADVITIPDAIPANVADCSVKIEPVQDLHGQSAPYVGGAGKNKLPLVLADIKTANTDGTWSGNVYTINGDTIEVLIDSDNNVLGFKINKTHNNAISFNIFDNKSYVFDGSYDFVGESILKNGEIAYTYTFDNTSIDITNPNGVTQVVDDNLNHAHIYIWAAKSCTNQIVTPMVCLSSETDKSFAPYTNICPISGHTEASVQRDGVNWFDGEYVVAYLENGIVYKTSSATARTAIVPIKGGQKYTIKKNGGNRFAICESSEYPLVGYTYTNLFFNESATQATVTTSNSAKYLLIYVTNDGTEPQLQVELGETATHYVPYAGKTYTIALGDTIYGGTVDFDSGVMTASWASEVFDGSSDENWGVGGGIRLFFGSKRLDDPKYGLPTEDQASSSFICNIGDIHSYIWIDSSNAGIAYANGLRVSTENQNPNDMTLEEFKTWLSSNNIQVVYELATPTTIQLTPQQIQLLKGQNTITASTGQISVTVNGVSGSIGAVQEQVNGLEEDVADVQANLTSLHIHKVVESSTTGTVSDKLLSLKTVYNNLTANQRKTAILIKNDKDNYFPLNNTGEFFVVFVNMSTTIFITINIQDGTSIIEQDGTKTDQSSLTNNDKYSIWVME